MSENAYRYQESKRVTIVGASVNLSLALIKIVVGLFGRSSALFADGIHSLSDLISDFFVLFAAKISNKGVDYNHPYGHRRIETLATIGLSVLLIGVGVSIAYDAIYHLLSDTTYVPDAYTIIAAIISVFANEWLFRYTLNVAKKIDSDLLKANAWHSRSDALSSIVVLVGLIGALLGFPALDAIAALVVCYLIIKMGIGWAIESFAELVDTGVDQETKDKIGQAITQTDGVKSYHQLRTRRMAGRIYLDVHVLVDHRINVSEGHQIGEYTRANIAKVAEDIEDVTVHIDVDNHPERIPKQEQLAPTRSQILAKMQPEWFKIINPNDIKWVDLQYLQGSIHLSLFLYAHVADRYDSDAIINQLKKTTAMLDRIESLEVFIDRN